MDIVPAGMHDPGHMRGIGLRFILVDGQRVNVGPQHHGATRTRALEDEHASGFTDPVELGGVEARHVVTDEVGGGVFGEGELGELMDGPAAVHHVVEERIDGGGVRSVSSHTPTRFSG